MVAQRVTDILYAALGIAIIALAVITWGWVMLLP